MTMAKKALKEMKRGRVARILVIFLLLIFVLPQSTWAADSCVFCHANKTKMQEFNFSEYYITNQEVWNQTGMFRLGLGGPRCYDCHRGNNNTVNLKKAHENLLRPFIILTEGIMPIERELIIKEIKQRQNFLPMLLIPRNSSLKSLLYHDRNFSTLAFDLDIANATCGKCHPQEVKDFASSPMGEQRYSRRYTSFTSPAPHNCGYWFTNLSRIRKELTVNYTKKQAELNQRVCNQCHVSCLDCHYYPIAGKHAFRRMPEPTSCYFGGGRGICHVGAEDYRRGAGYFREGGIPQLEDDIHAKENIPCFDCHSHNGHEISRDASASCIKCHKKIVESLKKSVHANLTCGACHITKLGGYQITIWGPGYYWGIFTPLTKLNAYGTLSNPILIRVNTTWMPVKPMPQAVLNQRKSLSPTSIKRRRNDTLDAYAIVGTFNNTILWIHMDKASHAFGKARSCNGCHSTNEQIAISNWVVFRNHSMKILSKGGHVVIANKTGLYILNMTQVKELHNANLTWYAKGDFSLPQKSKSCRENCEKCHGNAHLVADLKYEKIRTKLIVIFALSLFFSIIILMRK